MVAFFRRWYGLPVINFLDDLEFTLPELACRDGWRAFIAGAKLFGWLFDPEKDSPMSEVGPFLGFIEDFSQVPHDDTMTTQNKPAFLERLDRLLVDTTNAGVLHPGDGRSLVGKLLHRSEATLGRWGVWPITEHFATGPYVLYRQARRRDGTRWSCYAFR